MGFTERPATRWGWLRKRKQAFVSTILKQLNKPPFLPQLCSISSKLVIIHTMTPRPTVIGCKVIGVDLPAFLLSKNFCSESIGMSQSAVLRPPFSNGPHRGQVFKTFWDLSGGTYPFALRELAFQLCLPQLPLSF